MCRLQRFFPTNGERRAENKRRKMRSNHLQMVIIRDQHEPCGRGCADNVLYQPSNSGTDCRPAIRRGRDAKCTTVLIYTKVPGRTRHPRSLQSLRDTGIWRWASLTSAVNANVFFSPFRFLFHSTLEIRSHRAPSWSLTLVLRLTGIPLEPSLRKFSFAF